MSRIDVGFRHPFWAAILALVASTFGLQCSSEVGSEGKPAGDTHGAHTLAQKGAHGGRLLTSDNGLALEVTIYEPGVPPQSRVYPYVAGKLIPPEQVQLVVELHRFDRVDIINYSPQGTFLFGDLVVDEPHSFDVKLRASYRGKKYAWEYSSYEGRVEITAPSAGLSGIGLEKVEARELVERVPVLGRVGLNQDTVRHVSARYSGTITSLDKRIGDHVKAGETIASVVGTDSLSEFLVRAPGSGRVVEKRMTVGEVAQAGQVILVIADLSSVWVDFTVYRSDVAKIASRQHVAILPGEGVEGAEGTIAYLSPVGDGASQSVTARAVIQNRTGRLRPGIFVEGRIEVARLQAEMVVRREAVQTFRDWQVVFRNRETLYEIAIVELGLIDGDFVQVLSGLSPGDTYVARNSFIIKADIGKSGAAHHH